EPHLQGSDQSVWFRRLESEHDNLRAALERENKEASLRIGVALWWFWFVCGYWSEGRTRLKEAISQAGEAEQSRAVRAKAFQGMGALTYSQGDYISARTQYEESLAIYRELGDKRNIAGSLHNLGNIAYSQGDYTSARSLYEEALRINRESGNRAWEANNLGNL